MHGGEEVLGAELDLHNALGLKHPSAGAWVGVHLHHVLVDLRWVGDAVGG